MAWTGRTPGLRAVHTWRFHEVEGGTRVQTEEPFEGWLARLLGGWLRGNLAVTLAKGLEALRIESERRHGATGRPASCVEACAAGPLETAGQGRTYGSVQAP